MQIFDEKYTVCHYKFSTFLFFYLRIPKKIVSLQRKNVAS